MTVTDAGWEVYVCSNKACDAVWNADPQGHCPRCKQASGVGWSTMLRRVLSTTPIQPRYRLCAAAPEMLEALQMLAADVKQYEAWQRPCFALDKALAAIAKAEGRHHDRA